MAVFIPGETIKTAEPTIEVETQGDAPLKVGLHRFQLVVVDDSGNESEPAIVEVIVRDTQRPTAVLDVVREVEVGQNFFMSGKRSSDVPPGQVTTFLWTLLDPTQ